MVSQLEAAANLYRSHTIADAEFKEVKRIILANPGSPNPVISLLSRAQTLRVSGILTTSQFIKLKRQILSDHKVKDDVDDDGHETPCDDDDHGNVCLTDTTHPKAKGVTSRKASTEKAEKMDLPATSPVIDVDVVPLHELRENPALFRKYFGHLPLIITTGHSHGSSSTRKNEVLASAYTVDAMLQRLGHTKVLPVMWEAHDATVELPSGPGDDDEEDTGSRVQTVPTPSKQQFVSRRALFGRTPAKARMSFRTFVQRHANPRLADAAEAAYIMHTDRKGRPQEQGKEWDEFFEACEPAEDAACSATVLASVVDSLFTAAGTGFNDWRPLWKTARVSMRYTYSTHHDFVENVLLHASGGVTADDTKTLHLWHPRHINTINPSGLWSWAMLPGDRIGAAVAPAKTFRAHLQEGDALYIPYGWFHNITAPGWSVGMNTYMRSDKRHGRGARSSYGAISRLGPGYDSATLKQWLRFERQKPQAKRFLAEAIAAVRDQ